MAAEEEMKRIQIYSSSSSSSARQVTPFWKEKYEKDAKKYWDIFYRRHKDKFFKDRHYLDKEWGRYFQAQEGGKFVVLEELTFHLRPKFGVLNHATDPISMQMLLLGTFRPSVISSTTLVGCGAGNTIFPLISTYPNIFVHACDFSPRAVDLVKANKDFTGDKINVFVCDLTVHNLSEVILPSSVDIVTMVFMLSAVAPEKMPSVVQNIRNVLKPNGCVLLRDYATGDLAQERLTCKEQQISENFYVRGDGTRAYYFSTSFLTTLFTQNGFHVDEVAICKKQVENRSLELVMNRCWIQAVFSENSYKVQTSAHNQDINDHGPKSPNNDYSSRVPTNGHEIDISESIVEMFGISPSFDEVIEIKPRGYNFRIKGLSKEFQHTCKSTGLMIWESARFMCNVLAENPSIVSGKRVLELGCGSAGVCSMVALHHADLVVSTDGDAEALNLLRQNTVSNVEPGLVDKMVIKRLIWGNKADVDAVKDLYCLSGGFEVIIGTDVTYNPDAISPLFETAMELISKQGDEETRPALILCHIQRRVDEASIISAASRSGFRLVDSWVNGMRPNGGVVSSWFSQGSCCEGAIQNAPLTIL